MRLAMPSRLHRTYGVHHLHFITCSCYRRLPFLRAARSRDRCLSILEQVRERYRFVVIGYVVMPEHIHLLITEPEIGTPSKVMQVLKQRTARALLPKRKRTNPRQRSLFSDEPQSRAFWQARFYDFNVWTTKKRVEKLRYMHRNPVKRGLVESPEQWRETNTTQDTLHSQSSSLPARGCNILSGVQACRVSPCPGHGNDEARAQDG